MAGMARYELAAERLRAEPKPLGVDTLLATQLSLADVMEFGRKHAGCEAVDKTTLRLLAAHVLLERCGMPHPPELDTPQARDLWRLAQEQGWVDERLRPKLPSDNQAAVLADVMAEALALSPRWAPFERLWGIKDLVHKHSQAKLYAYYDELRDKMKFELN